jgi:hypothetical protein
VRQLLAGEFDETRLATHRQRRWAPWIAAGLLLAAVGIGFSGVGSTDEAQAGAFFGAGALVLAALLTWLWDRFRDDSNSSLIGRRWPLVHLAIRNTGRHPLRSTMTIGLMAAACFLIVAVSAFQLDPPSAGPKLNSGDGGFALLAHSDQPIYQDLNLADARQELGFSQAAEQTVTTAASDGAHFFSLRVQAGDDASCLNLYQPRQPWVLGLSDEFMRRGGFAWSATSATTPEQIANPWVLLNRKRGSTPAPKDTLNGASDAAAAIPVVLDQNTAMYSLHLYGGAGEAFEIDNPRGGKIKLEVVGLLKNSIFQGDLLISDENFQRLFPETSGYRMFLIDAPPQKSAAVAEALENSLGDYGFTTQTTAARLAGFFAVQNTYLATFRSLGGLGLLLGTFGLVAVQLRNIVQRRGELALLQATGFRRRRLASLVMFENAFLLIAGLGIGTVAALVTLLPHFLAGGASIPWLSLAATLAVVLVVGLLAGLTAVRAALHAPLLSALRGN